MKFVFFQFRRTDKMDSVVKELIGAMPLPRIFGLEPPLFITSAKEVTSLLWFICCLVG